MRVGVDGLGYASEAVASLSLLHSATYIVYTYTIFRLNLLTHMQYCRDVTIYVCLLHHTHLCRASHLHPQYKLNLAPLVQDLQ